MSRLPAPLDPSRLLAPVEKDQSAQQDAHHAQFWFESVMSTVEPTLVGSTNIGTACAALPAHARITTETAFRNEIIDLFYKLWVGIGFSAPRI